MCACQRGLAGLTEEDHPEKLDHDVGGECGRERNQGRADRQHHVDECPGHFVREEERLQEKPLGHEAVEGRQSCHRERPDQREPGDPRHAMNQAAQAPEVALTGGVQNRSRTEKQQTLHERVIEAVIQGGDQRERGEGIHAHAVEHDGKPDGRKDDAEVLDR